MSFGFSRKIVPNLRLWDASGEHVKIKNRKLYILNIYNLLFFIYVLNCACEMYLLLLADF